MKSKKNIMAITTATLVILATSVTAFATSSHTTPAGALAEITGKTVESIVAEKTESGKTYGSIAAEAGKLDEFKAISLEAKKENLYTQVANGSITQEKANAIIKTIEDAQASCNGTQSQAIGKNTGAKFGSSGTGLGVCSANKGTRTGKNIGNSKGIGAEGL